MCTLCSRLVSIADVKIHITWYFVRAERTGWSHARLCVLPVVHFQNLLMFSLHAISTPVCTGSDTTANLAVLQTGTTDPKSCDVKFRRQRPDMQSCTLLGAYILFGKLNRSWQCNFHFHSTAPGRGTWSSMNHHNMLVGPLMLVRLLTPWQCNLYWHSEAWS